MEIMDIKYILLGLGSIIIFISLFIIYRDSRKRDNYYLETEMISEIREFKKDLQQQLDKSDNDFQDILNNEVDDTKLKNEIKIIKRMVKKNQNILENIQQKFGNNLFSTTKSNIANSNMNNKFNSNNSEYQKIKSLLDQGLKPFEIAQKLDLGTREVELIIKLNSRRDK